MLHIYIYDISHLRVNSATGKRSFILNGAEITKCIDLNVQQPKVTSHASGLDMSLKGILCKSADFSDPKLIYQYVFLVAKTIVLRKLSKSKPHQKLQEDQIRTPDDKLQNRLKRTVQLEPHKSAAAQRRQSVRRH